MSFSHLSSLTDQFQIFPFGDGVVLHRPGSQRLWALNQSAATIWCLLPEVENETALAREYAQRFGISTDQALVDIAAVLNGLETRGLSGEVDSEEAAPDPYPGDGPEVEAPDSEPCRVVVGAFRIDLFCAEAALLRQFSAVFPVASPGGDVDLHLAVHKNSSFGAGYAIARNRRIVVAGLAADEVLPHLVTLSFYAVCESCRDDFLLHAAVLEKEGQQLLLPGNTCSGKSTLAARLAADGWTCCSDELASLNLSTGHLSGLPLPLVLKSGSFEPLRRFYPELEASPVHRRMDGQLARYLRTRPVTVEDTGHNKPPILVFPSYRAGHVTELTRLTPAAILEGLAEVGSSERPLTRDDVQALIGLAEKATGYGLVFGDLEEAVGAVCDL